MRNQPRLNKKIDDLNRQWNLLNEKLNRLGEQLILETRPEERFRLEKLIDNTKTQLNQVEKQLNDVESRLDKVGSDTKEGAGRNDDHGQVKTPPGALLSVIYKLKNTIEQAKKDRIDVMIITLLLIIGGFILFFKLTEKNPECDSVMQAQNQKLIILSPMSEEPIPRCGIMIRGQIEGFLPDEINNRGLQVEVKLDNISGNLLSGVNSEDGIWSVKENSCVKGNVVKLIAILKDKGGKKLSAACRSITLLP